MFWEPKIEMRTVWVFLKKPIPSFGAPWGRSQGGVMGHPEPMGGNIWFCGGDIFL